MEIGRTTELDIEIVGLAQDAKYSEVKGEVPPLFFRVLYSLRSSYSSSFATVAYSPPTGATVPASVD